MASESEDKLESEDSEDSDEEYSYITRRGANKKKPDRLNGEYSYQNTIKIRVMGQPCIDCKMECDRRIVERFRQDNYLNFWGKIKDWEERRLLIRRLVQVLRVPHPKHNTRKKFLRKYFLEMEDGLTLVCKTMFFNTLAISVKFIETTLQKYPDNILDESKIKLVNSPSVIPKSLSVKNLNDTSSLHSINSGNNETDGLPFIPIEAQLLDIKNKEELKPPCSCPEQCGKKFAHETRVKIYEHFWQLKSWEERKLFIINTIEKDRYTSIRTYVLPMKNGGHITVCQEMYLNTLSLSVGFVDIALPPSDPGKVPKRKHTAEMKLEQYPEIKLEQNSAIKLEKYPGLKLEQYPGLKLEQYPGLKLEQYPGLKLEQYPGLKLEHYPGLTLEPNTAIKQQNTATKLEQNTEIKLVQHPAIRLEQYPAIKQEQYPAVKLVQYSEDKQFSVQEINHCSTPNSAKFNNSKDVTKDFYPLAVKRIKLEFTPLKPPCSCTLKCRAKLTEDIRQQIHKEFWNLPAKVDQKHFILSTIQVQINRNKITKEKTHQIKHFMLPCHYDNVVVCKEMYLQTLTISEEFVSSTIKNVNNDGSIIEDEDLQNVNEELTTNHNAPNDTSNSGKKVFRKQANKVVNADLLEIQIKEDVLHSEKSEVKKLKKNRTNKKMGPTCPASCRHQCSVKFTEEQRQELHDKFWESNWQERKQFVMNTVKEFPIKNRSIPGRLTKRNFSRIYTLPLNDTKVTVCQKMYFNTLSICSKFVSTVHIWASQVNW